MTAGGRFSMYLDTYETSFVRKFRSCEVQRCALSMRPPSCVLHDRYLSNVSKSHNTTGCCGLQAAEYAPIRQDYEDFYTRRMYYRLHVRIHAAMCRIYDAEIDCVYPLVLSVAPTDAPVSLIRPKQDCFNRPISSAPDAHVDVLLRQPPQGQKCVTLSSLTCLHDPGRMYLHEQRRDVQLPGG